MVTTNFLRLEVSKRQTYTTMSSAITMSTLLQKEIDDAHTRGPYDGLGKKVEDESRDNRRARSGVYTMYMPI